MAIISNPAFRCPERYIVTVEHGPATRSYVEAPERFSAQEAAEWMRLLIENHKPATEGTSVANYGRPKYRLWKMVGSAQMEDLERV